MQKDKSGGDNNRLPSKVLNEVLEWVESFIFAVFVVILIFMFVFRNVVVEGPSMNSTLSDGDRLIIYHFNYKPQRGDIIVLNSVGLGKTIIKRCIGIGGDTVRIDYSDNSVTVNGEKLEEDYINEEMTVLPGFDTQYLDDNDDNVFEYQVPEGKLFVMGDNRNHSTDSRSYLVGFIDEDDVLGKAIFRILPFSGFGRIR
ncbi:signal peptidase I [Ruminococcus sp. Marseille-P6503]|uniref:signal peptidase I n=1 Tax=Ruminococcus sp. Marseille-P6503 TaxID=2364796 RepID=UPI000F52A195|nr:signal peptidase I [Ruminococcus sp. Marseille-P6503]